MKPLAPVVLSAVMALSFSPRLAAQVTEDPAASLAAKMANEPGAREAAGKRLEAFLLTPETGGKRFVAEGADRAALGAVVRAWARESAAGEVAALHAVAAPGSKSEARLRSALARWTDGDQLKMDAGPRQAAAFLSDAAKQAAAILSDGDSRAEVDAAVNANDGVAPAVPDADRKAVERARKLNADQSKGLWFADWMTPRDAGTGGTNAAPAAHGAYSPLRATDIVAKTLYTGVTSAAGRVVPSPADSVPPAPAGGSESTWKSMISYSQSLGESMMNPLMMVLPFSIGGTRLAPRINSAPPGSSPAALPALPAPPAPAAVISVIRVGEAEREASRQAYLKGVIDFQKGDYERAEAQWREAAKADPGNKDAAAGLEKIRKIKAPVE